EKLRELLIQEKPDLVFHLAARAGVRPSLQNPTLYMRVNVEGTTGLLQAAVLAKVKRVVMASSSSVYGNSASVPFQVSEKNLRPISPYGASKLASEAIGYSYAENYRLPVIALRFFTVYGPRQRPDLAIHKFMRLIDENKPIEMFGDGSTSRDYTFIDDIIEGVLASAEVEISTSEIPFRVYNIGSESPISLKEMISAIETVTGKKAQLIPKPEQTGDVKRTFADVTQSEKDFKYRPKESFAKGLEKFWSWYQTEKANRR
ncbi:MAG: epimerase, partial [Bdellovibrio sp. CG10_big_fil_rev_8_21_14_0_10_47_8]